MEDIVTFIRMQPSKSFSKNEILIYQDNEPDALFAIRSGFVKIHDMAGDGTEQLIWLAKKYDILPIEWLFGKQKSSPYFYTAHTDVEAFIINKQAFLEHATQNKVVLLAIVQAITEKYNDTLRHINASQKPKARDKLIYSLHFIAARFAEDEYHGMQPLELPLTHQDLANLVGISRETASLELKKLKDEGVVAYSKTSFLVHPHKLAELIT